MMTKNNFFVSITIIDFQIFVWSDWRTNKREVEFEKVKRGLLKMKSKAVLWIENINYRGLNIKNSINTFKQYIIQADSA